MFVKIPPDLLRIIATDSERMPRLYYHPLAVARSFFWSRLKHIHGLMNKHLRNRDSCLDFACGSGVFLPTLSSLFRSVRGIDIELVEAPKIVEQYSLSNVRLTSADIYTAGLDERFDAIVAADVLEHFEQLDKAVLQLKHWLKDDGLLFTSLPTENVFTRFTRVLGGYTKPADHYRSGEEVEEILRSQGFRKIESRTILFFFPLYLIGVWEKTV